MQSFVIKNGSEEIGSFPDINPVSITTDEECLACVEDLLDRVTTWSEEETQVLKACKAVCLAKEDDDVEFGPVQLLAIVNMAMSHPNVANELASIMVHMSETVDNELERPPEWNLLMLKTYSSIGKPMTRDPNAEVVSDDSEDESVEDFEEGEVPEPATE